MIIENNAQGLSDSFFPMKDSTVVADSLKCHLCPFKKVDVQNSYIALQSRRRVRNWEKHDLSLRRVLSWSLGLDQVNTTERKTQQVWVKRRYTCFVKEG